MKKIFTLLLSVLFVSSLMAQSISLDKATTQYGNNLISDEQNAYLHQMKTNSAPLIDQSTNSQQGIRSFYVDYEAYDSGQGGYADYARFRWRLHSDYTPNDHVYIYDQYDPTLIVDSVFLKFSKAAVAFNWLNESWSGIDADGYLITPDDSTTYEWSTASVTIDSIFYPYAHINNSATTTELRTRILPVDAFGRPNYNATPLWEDVVTVDSSLTGADNYGDPLFAQAEIAVNLSLPLGTEGVAVAVDLTGGDKLTDEFYLIAGWPTNCTTDDDASYSRFKPNSFTEIELASVYGSQFVNGFQPDAAGDFNFWWDNNGSGYREDCEIFNVIDWAIWMKVTADIPLAITAESNSAVSCPGGLVTLSSLATAGVEPINYVWTTDGGGTIISATNATTDVIVEETATYTVTATDANGESISTTVDVTVDDIAVAIAGDVEVTCPASSAQLIAQATSSFNNDFSYDWSFATEDTAIVNVFVGNHEVTVTNANGCSATESISVAFDNSTLQSGFDYINTYGSSISFTNTSTDATSYIWDFGDGSNPSITESPLHIYENGGVYSVELQALATPCTHTTVKTVSVGQPTGLEEELLSAELKLFPNPASDYYNIQIEAENSELIEVSIYNVSGELQYSVNEMNTINDRVDLEEFTTGVYFVNIMIDDVQVTRKLIVNK